MNPAEKTLVWKRNFYSSWKTMNSRVKGKLFVQRNAWRLLYIIVYTYMLYIYVIYIYISHISTYIIYEWTSKCFFTDTNITVIHVYLHAAQLCRLCSCVWGSGSNQIWSHHERHSLRRMKAVKLLRSHMNRPIKKDSLRCRKLQLPIKTMKEISDYIKYLREPWNTKV